MPSINISPIPGSFTSLGRVFDPNIYEREWYRVLQKEIKTHRPLWDSFTATWRSKPSWKTKKERGKSADSMYVQDTTKDTPFVFVEGGTKSMPRAYVHNFSPKTTPGSLVSRPGSRGYIKVHRGMKPGIKARNVRETIKEQREAVFFDSMRRATAIATRRALGRYRR